MWIYFADASVISIHKVAYLKYETIFLLECVIQNVQAELIKST